MSRMISFLVLVLILAAIGTIFFRVMSGFLVPIFLAALLGVIFQPVHHWIHQRIGRWGRYVSAGATTFVAGFIVLAPAVLIIFLAIFEGISLANQLGDVSVRRRLDQLREQLGLDIPHYDDLQKIQDTLQYLKKTTQRGETPLVAADTLDNLYQRADRIAAFVTRQGDDGSHEEIAPQVDPSKLQKSLRELDKAVVGEIAFDDALDEAIFEFKQFRLEYLGGPYRAWIKELIVVDDTRLDTIRDAFFSRGSVLLDLSGDTASIVIRSIVSAVIMLATLFFLFADGPVLLDTVISFSPLEEHYVRELLIEFDRASRAVVLATLLSALAQGLLAGIGYQVAGVGSVFLLTLMTTVLAMVPFLGAASVWISVCLWLYFSEGHIGAAIGMAIYGTFVVSLVDNIIKPLVLHGQSNLHPLLALLSILGGVQVMGPIGILVGPMSVVFLQTVVRILHREYKVFEQRMEIGDTPSEESSPHIPQAGLDLTE